MQGASVVYRKALQPLMRQHQQHIDKYVEMGEKNLRKQMAQLVRLNSRCKKADSQACAIMGICSAAGIQPGVHAVVSLG